MHRPLCIALCVFLASVCEIRHAHAEHTIEEGDVLDFSVANLPSLKQRVTVDVNGVANFPLLQDINAAGLPLAELQTKVRDLISAKPFRQRSSEGQETLLTIDPDEITVSIVEYRPIYVTGDVAKPGEQAFRPGLTVRQATVLSGGLRRIAGVDTSAEADLRSTYKNVFANYIAARLTVGRLQAELAEQTVMPVNVISSAPIDQTLQRAMVDREAQRLSIDITSHTKEREYILQSIDESDKLINALAEQQRNEKEGAALDAQDFARNKELFDKGAVPVTRLTDSRRSLLLSATRQLQTTVAIAEGGARKDSLVHSLDKLDNARRVDLLRDLEEAQLKFLDQDAKLRNLSNRFASMGQSSDSTKAKSPEARINRKGAGEIEPGPDDELQPGDVLTLTVSSDPFEAAATR